MSKALAIIPARFHSTRFPGKPLAQFMGKPLIQHVWERVSKAEKIERVTIATDHQEILRRVIEFGGEGVLTSSFHRSGTERVAEVARKMDYEIVVNVQGDEPMIEPSLIDEIVETLRNHNVPMASVYEIWDSAEEFFNPNVVKVVLDKDDFGIYFSRSPIPYSKEIKFFFRHVGIYGYKKETLLKLVDLPPSPLEVKENLEQLRAVENGIRIKMIKSLKKSMGIDTPEDLKKVEELIKNG